MERLKATGLALTVMGTLCGPVSAQSDEEAIQRAIGAGATVEVFMLLERSANAGNAESQYRLASLYRLGRGIEQDDAKAFQWMQSAAGKGLAKAQYALGQMYLTGRGVAANRERAEIWLTRSSAQKYGKAAEALAKLATARVAAASPAGRAAATAKPPAQPPKTNIRLPLTLANGRPAILEAALRGQSEAVSRLLKAGADREVRDDDGNTALALAAGAAIGGVPTIELLHAAGAAIDARNAIGETPLFHAVKNGRTDAVRILLAKGAGANKLSEKRETPLALAIAQCREDLIDLLLSSGADVNANIDGSTPLSRASRACNAQAVGKLIAQGAKVNVTDANGRTASWHAVDAGNQPALEVLLDVQIRAGADINNPDNDGVSLLHQALSRKNTQIATLLLSLGADAQKATQLGNTPLMLAAKEGLTQLIPVIVKNGADPNVRNTYGYTALMMAAGEGQAETVGVLLGLGADPGLRNKKRERAVDIAASRGHRQIAEAIQ